MCKVHLSGLFWTFYRQVTDIIKFLLTGLKGIIMSFFPKTLPRETLRSRGKNSLFPTGPVIKCLLYLATQNYEKPWRNHLLYPSWLTNLPLFQGARPDHVRVESSCYCFPRELVSFVRPRELVKCWHTTCDAFSSNRKTYLSWEV